MQVCIISATRFAEAEFWQKAALGISLQRLACDARLEARIAFANRNGLPVVYNTRLAEASPETALVFVHDDVWIDDHFFCDRILEGLRHFDVLGVAGNLRRGPGQPAWAFPDLNLKWDEAAYLSGSVAHGRHPFGIVSRYGDTGKECELLDGVLLAVLGQTFHRTGLAFDPRFAFHFYDMDFCRAARALGLRLGTWPIAVTHQSGGRFGTTPWREAFEIYAAKWETGQSAAALAAPA